MIDKQKVIDIAISQIGYHEKATNAQLDDFYANSGSHNWHQFARDLDAISGFYNGVKNIGDEGHWCDIFVDACFVLAYGVTLAMELLCQPWGSAGAGCEYSAGYYKAKGQFYNYPEVGDQIFFDYGGGINHTGLVVAVDGMTVTTVEGNADDQVKQCSYSIASNVIAGYGRPNWAIDGEAPEPEPVETTCEITVTAPIVKYGNVSPWVAIMQICLISRGFSCGRYGADGEYGADTKNALQQFQNANGLTADGICEKETWQKLIGG